MIIPCFHSREFARNTLISRPYSVRSSVSGALFQQYSLYFPCLSGNSSGDRFDQDCQHRHHPSQVVLPQKRSSSATRGYARVCTLCPNHLKVRVTNQSFSTPLILYRRRTNVSLGSDLKMAICLAQGAFQTVRVCQLRWLRTLPCVELLVFG